MKDEIPITKQISETIIKIYFDTVAFSQLYDQDNLESAKKVFQCNEDIKKGMKWLLGSQNDQNMQINIEAYIQTVDTTLRIYNNLHIPFENKENLICTLNKLHNHLCKLQNQINIIQE